MEVVFAKDKKKTNPLLDKGKDLLKKIKNYKAPNAFYYFLLLIAISVGFYMMMLVENGFSLAYGGDYTAQYIPMGYHVWDYYHDWFRTGHFTLFDPAVYLGVNSIGSNAYYGLFSPFNIIIVLLPRAFVPTSVAIASFVKLACAGLFFSIYVKKSFKVKERVSFICGIAYAFAGWGAFYLWYNNYQDILVFFPLVLLGIEKTIQEKKPWILALGVFFLAICNYVLMVSYILCAFFYAMFRFFQTLNKRTVSDNFIVLGLGVVGFAGGLLMSSFVFVPALMATLSSPKLDTNSYGDLLKQYLNTKDYKHFFQTLFLWNEVGDQHGYVIPQRVLYPILEFFFPPTTCRSLPSLELYSWDFDDMAVSLWCYVPFIMFLVPALIQSGKEKKWSHYIGFALLLVTLFTPFMYFLTMGFTNGYARWTLFIVSSLIAYVGIYIDKIPNVSRWHMHLGFYFAVAGIVTVWILTYKLNGQTIYLFANGSVSKLETRYFIKRLEDNGKDYTNIAFIIELCYVTAVYLTLFFTYKKKVFYILATVFVSIEAIAVGNFVTVGHGYSTGNNNGYALNQRVKKTIDKIEKTDKNFYRYHTFINDGGSDNNGLMNNYSSANFFHSLYNFEVNDFAIWTGIRGYTKSVSGTYHGKHQDLDNLLGIKYYIVGKEKSNYYNIENNFQGGYIANVPFDFVNRTDLETDEYLVYENTSLSDFGYSYSTLFSDTAMYGSTRIDAVKNAIALSKASAMSKADIEEINSQHPEIIAQEKIPTVDSIKLLTANVDFYRYFYDIWKETYNPETNSGGRHAKSLSFEEVPNVDATYTPTSYVYNTDGKSPNFKSPMDYYTVFKSPQPNQPLFKANTTLYVKAHFSNSQKYDFYFMDQDNHIVMFDSHDDDNTDNLCDIRGFYIRKDIYKMAVCPIYINSFTDDTHSEETYNFRMYVEDYDVYQQRREALNANPITDVTYRKDKFTFKTNYTSDRFVVSRVAFDRGWKIKATNNDTKETGYIKAYKGNGAFVSFVAPKGNYSYVMVYETPYLKLTYVLSAFSIGGFFLSMLAYHFIEEKKRTHHLDQLFREN